MNLNDLAKLRIDRVAQTLVFSLAMGLAGGFLPALRAPRLEIVDALRAA